MKVDAHHRGEWVDGIVESVSPRMRNFSVRLKDAKSKHVRRVEVPRALIARNAQKVRMQQKARLDMATPRRPPASKEAKGTKVDFVQHNIDEARANKGLGSRIPKVVVGWAGPEFKDKMPFWARDKYLPARYQGLDWDQEANNGNGAYVTGVLGLEELPPRNTRGNLNYGDKNWGKVPAYLAELSRTAAKEEWYAKLTPRMRKKERDKQRRPKSATPRVRTPKPDVETQLKELREEKATLETQYCKVNDVIDGPLLKTREKIEARLGEVEAAICKLLGKPPPRKGPF